MKDVLLGLVMNNFTGIVLAVVALVGFILGSSANRKRQVALATYHAFLIVEDLVAEGGTSKSPVLDKALAGLKTADEYMRANGWRPLKPNEQEVAKLTFKSMNAQTDAAVAVLSPSLPPAK